MNNNFHEPRSIRSNTPDLIDPAAWWRTPCPVHGSAVVLCGDLPSNPLARIALLDQWEASGVGHIIDVRIERNDSSTVRSTHPHLGYSWLGVDDDGGRQADEWFQAGVDAALAAIADSATKVLVHCHMGINRGPSMGFAILLATGWEPVAALEAIRAARPIAAVLYAEDALRWWHGVSNTPAEVAARQRDEVADWFAANPIDAHWVISRIWRADCE